ncbi:casein kinase 2 regulatory subunit [Mortierella sp. GBA35]|nr:casein kinase 2 regulatory subunit [Mortierella sp. AD031]KAF9105410.1 casein kinase 2 regulatory subunit [Mortierella sp. GBA35]KAG0213745.1 casein kinase 2 regulatory subunit [Mortierella sp. NVP41]
MSAYDHQQQQQQLMRADNVEEEEEEEDEEDEEQLQGEYNEEYYGSDGSNETGPETMPWIAWFCSLGGHQYFAEVADEFVEDDFNLTGLNSIVPFYKEALDMILDLEPEEDSTKVPDVSIVEASAEQLYGLIHQRFIVTRQGLQQMADKYQAGHFGSCPRTFCQSTNVVPCGRYDLPGVETVKLYCPNCQDIYSPPSSRYHNLDGAYFGTTFAHMLFHIYPELVPNIPNKIYAPAIYGFKISEYSRCGPRMQWLRNKQDPKMLDASGKLIKDSDDDDK